MMFRNPDAGTGYNDCCPSGPSVDRARKSVEARGHTAAHVSVLGSGDPELPLDSRLQPGIAGSMVPSVPAGL